MDRKTLDSMVEGINRRILEFNAPDVPEIGYRGISNFSDEERSKLVARINKVLPKYTSLIRRVTETQEKVSAETGKYSVSEALKRQIGEEGVSMLTEKGFIEVTLGNISSFAFDSGKITLSFISKEAMEKYMRDYEEIKRGVLSSIKEDPKAVKKMKKVADHYSRLVDVALEFVQLKPIEQNNSNIATIFYTTDKTLYAITLNLDGNSNNKGKFDIEENSIDHFISDIKRVFNGKKLDFYNVESPFSEDALPPHSIFRYFADKMQREYERKNPEKAAEREKVETVELLPLLMAAKMLKEKLSGKSQAGQYGEQVNVIPIEKYQNKCPSCLGKEICLFYKAAEEFYGKSGKIIWQ